MPVKFQLFFILVFSIISGCGGGGSSSNSSDGSNTSYEIQVNAGSDMLVTAGDLVSIFGVSEEAVKFNWTTISGRPIIFYDKNNKQTTFKAPNVTEDSTAEIELKAMTDDGGIGTDRILIDIKPKALTVGFPTHNSSFRGDRTDVTGRIHISNVGNSTPKITVDFGGATVEAVIENDGFWRAKNVDVVSTNGNSELSAILSLDGQVVDEVSNTVKTDLFYYIRDIAYDKTDNSAYIATKLGIQHVNLTTNARKMISSDSIGSGVDYFYLDRIVLDKVNRQILGINNSNHRKIIAINIDNGHRTILSSFGNSIGSGDDTGYMTDLVLDESRNRLLVSSSDFYTSINLVDGSRNIDGRMTNEISCRGPLAVNDEAAEIYSINSCTGSIIKYDPDTQTFIEINIENSSISNTIKTAKRFIFDKENNRFIIATINNGMFIYEVEKGEASNISSPLFVYAQSPNGLALLNDGNYIASFGDNSLVRVNKDTLVSTLLMSDKTGSGHPFGYLGGVVFNSSLNELLVLNKDSDLLPLKLMNIDLLDGSRTEISLGFEENLSIGLGQKHFDLSKDGSSFVIGHGWASFMVGERIPDNTLHSKINYAPDLIDQLIDIIYIKELNSLVYIDSDNSGSNIFKKNIQTNELTLLARMEGVLLKDLVKSETNPEEIFVLGRLKEVTYPIDTTTSIDSVNANSGVVTNLFSAMVENVDPEKFVLSSDAKKAYVFSSFFDQSILEINLISGHVSLISGELGMNTAGQGIESLGVEHMALDEYYQRLIINDRWQLSVTIVDLESGNRVSLTKP